MKSIQAGPEGGQPWRTRDTCPSATAGPSSALQSNECLEFGIWPAQQALSCETKQAHFLLVAPEDFGGEAIHGPATLGDQFWLTYWPPFFKKPFSLREGANVQKVSNSEGYPLAARSGSRFSLLCLWKNGGLNRTKLRDWADKSQVDLYYDTGAPLSLAPSARSLLWQHCSRLRWSRDNAGAFSGELDPSALGLQKGSYGLRAAAPLDTLSSTSSVRALDLRKGTWLQRSRGEVALTLACCFLLHRLRMHQFLILSGRRFTLLIMS